MTKFGKLHVSVMWSGIAIMWLNPDARGTWHWAISWANPAVQCGHIGKRGYGGMLWDRKSYRNVGAWRR